jgi:hypothetical protein
MTACELERFMEKVDRSGDCWLWTAGLNAKGYGAFYQQGTMRRAHRVAFEHFVGPVPEGLELDHSCRNRACVNPAHLRVVTFQSRIVPSPSADANVLPSGAKPSPSTHHEVSAGERKERRRRTS